MNKGVLIWHVRREDKESGEWARVGAKSKREGLTMGRRHVEGRKSGQ